MAVTGGDLEHYIGEQTTNVNANLWFSSRIYNQARGYLYYDSTISSLKIWDGASWLDLTKGLAISPWTESPAGLIYPTTHATDDVVIGANAMASDERFRVVGAARVEKSTNENDEVLYLQASSSHPVAEPVLMIDQDVVASTAGALRIDSEVSSGAGAPLIELLALNTNGRGDIAFGTARTGNPNTPVEGDFWYESTSNVFRYHDGASIQTLATGGSSPWSEAAGVIYPATYSTDDVVIGANAMTGTERLRVNGNVLVDDQIGVGAPPAAGVNIFAYMDGSASGVGIISEFESDGTNVDIHGLDTAWDVNAGHTINSYTGIRLQAPDGTGTVTTNVVGLYVGDMSLNVTVSGDSYGIYQSSSGDKNRFEGPLQMGQRAADPGSPIEGEFWYNATTNVLKYYDGASTLTLATGASSSPWTESPVGTIFPTTFATDDVIIGANATTGTERLRVNGNVLVDDQIGVGAPPAAGVNIFAYMDGSASGVGIISEFESDGTNVDIHGIDTAWDVNAGHTINSYTGIRIQSPDGTGTVTTNVVGVYVEDMSLNVTVSGVSYGIYQAASEDKNRFEGPLQMGQRAADPGSPIEGEFWYNATTNVLKYYDGASTLTLATGASSSPWTESPVGTIFPTTFATDDVIIGANAMIGTERFLVVGNARVDQGNLGIRSAPGVSTVLVVNDDQSITGDTMGVYVYQGATVTGTKVDWDGVSVRGGHASTGAITTSRGFNSLHALGAAGSIVTAIGYESSVGLTNASDVVTTYQGVLLKDSTGTGTITTSYGIDIEDQGLNSTTTYGIRIQDQSGTTAYGIYQAGSGDKNYFAGNIGVNQSVIGTTYYVDVLDDEESNPGGGYRVRLEKDAAGAKSQYRGFLTDSSVDAGSVVNLYGFQSSVVTGGGDITTCSDYIAGITVGTGDTVTTKRGVYLVAAFGAGTITTSYGIDIEDQGLNSTTTYGIRIKDQSGTTAYGIYQEGSGDRNYFAGRVGIGGELGNTKLNILHNSSSGYLHGIYNSVDFSSGAMATYTCSAVFARCLTTATIGSWYGYEVIAPAGVSSSITTAYGLYVQDLQTGSVPSTSYGIYQAGSSDDNYFNGSVGIKDSTPSYPLDVAGDINVQTGSVYRHNGSAGLSATYTFGGGSTGDIASMTFAGGILTAVTTVP